MWPTPNVPNGGRSVAHAERIGRSYYHKGKKVQLGLEAVVRMAGGGQLNPDWVEWLMGWPIGWTASEPLAMARFREWWRQHGGS